MEAEKILTAAVQEAMRALYGAELKEEEILIQQTRREFAGDLTVVVFPFLRYSRKSPADTGEELGRYLTGHIGMLSRYEVIKGFLNLSFSMEYWSELLNRLIRSGHHGLGDLDPLNGKVVVEYSSPNTNKPLHLGHIRNNLLGFSISRILEALGSEVVKVNLVNDRGIHICKSMLAWKKSGKGETPASSGKKGDHLVGDYYVLFEQEYRKQVEELKKQGMAEEEARRRAPLIVEAQDMLRRWEEGNEEVRELWAMMNEWVYEGFDETYRALGVDFDRIYYESETYRLGKSLVLEGLEKGILHRRADGSVWADLSEDGLDEKLLLRSDGTSVYMTQDLGTAQQRYEDYRFDRHIYVVGNEQNYHFQVLKLILKKLGYDWADSLYHLSYGMVELPEGKMKSREGTVVDADDLIAGMVDTAREMSKELGKLEGFDPAEIEEILRMIGLGALKYFILKVDPKKNMTFNPRESVDFNGNTGPFIQYTYARIQSVVRKAGETGRTVAAELPGGYVPCEKERDLIRILAGFAATVHEAGREYNPAVLANYLYELSREYNQFYHDHSILGAPDEDTIHYRLLLSVYTGRVIARGMYLLGIDVPPRM
ncbi:MAG TPA: arginine--tRNA ligase [Bacteroidetes bacterium]|nr:arginine--tRNA ligase [Bacteroidota bacterium]